MAQDLVVREALMQTLGDGHVRFLEDNDRYTNRMNIPSSSSTRLYLVAQNKKTGDWSCSCMGWIRYQRCRHLTAMMPVLANAPKRKSIG